MVQMGNPGQAIFAGQEAPAGQEAQTGRETRAREDARPACPPLIADGARPEPLRTKAESSMLGPMAGRSLAMQHLFARMRCTAPHFRMAAIEGEPGTGKLLAAQTLHRMGPGRAGAFAPCTAEEFLRRPGEIWSDARRGLIYLARIDELSGEMQRQLRDFLERAAHERIRLHVSTGPAQLVVGAQQPLRRLAAAGTFRPDLAAHLTAIRFCLPPLRERREDIPLLAELFLERWSRHHDKPLRGFAPGTLARLAGHTWPGNVRELENMISAAALETTGQWIRPIDVPRFEWPAQPVEAVAAEMPVEDPNLDRAILRHVTRVLARVNGNKVRAARMLGISRSTLYRMLDAGSGVST